ncbi:PAS domain S-box protein [Salirhabdus sp. Marseille-P4669]|uniref:PAS domain S-box protein n=1 Tax=Salirhabdus sp. Marseille-P4669 TaxID=2042310 RepID=UPI000C7E2990|nr:PAS domain S-box protein [Salirhabdus sp. Marseille-P4669]
MTSISSIIRNLTGIFGAIDDLVFFMRAVQGSFRYEYANESALALLNIEEKTLIGSLMEDVLPNDMARSLIDKYNEAINDNKKVVFEERLAMQNGFVIGETSLTPLVFDDIPYVLGIVRDITSRKRSNVELNHTKVELERSNKRLQSLVDHNGDAIYELDLEGNFKSFNKKALEITGYSKEELMALKFSDLLVEEYKAELLAHFNDGLQGEQQEFEGWIYNRKGEKILLEIKSIPILIDGKLEGIYGISRDITEERKLKKLLEENRQKYESLFEHHPDAIFTYDIEGYLLDGNKSAEKFTGYSRDEGLGTNFADYIVPEDVEKSMHHFHKAIEEKSAESCEIAMQRKDGQRVDLFVTNVPIVVDHEVIGVFGLARDITAEKHAQKVIRETKEELESFWNYSADPIFFFANNQIVKVNPAFEKMFGFTEKEMLQDGTINVPAHLKWDHFEINRRIQKGEVIKLYETKRLTKAGEQLDIIATYTPIKNDKGEIIGGTAFYKDVTEYKEYQRKLLKSEEKFRLITENAFDGIKLVNTSGIVEYLSPSYERIIGYTESEYMNKPFGSIYQGEERDKLEKEFRDVLSGKRNSLLEVKLQHKRGHWIWLEVAMAPIMEDGKMNQVVCISRDITERRKQRDVLKELAYHDYLTGLPNRRVFDDRLEQGIEAAKQNNKKLAVMMIDGLKFKTINDHYGHDAGDAVLKELAIRIQSCVRKTDIVARIGGDEMGVILGDLDSEKVAIGIAERIVKSFEKPLVYNGQDIQMGAGVGISFYPDHASVRKQLVKLADYALYDAKELEQSAYRIYSC